MKYDAPFYVHGQLVSVHNGKTVRIYLNRVEDADKHRDTIDAITQYLMDERFVTVDNCVVEIHCRK